MTVFGLLHPAREHMPVLTSLAPGTVNLGVPAVTGAGAGVVVGGGVLGVLAGVALVATAAPDVIGAVVAATVAAGCCAAAVPVSSEPVPVVAGLAVTDKCLWA